MTTRITQCAALAARAAQLLVCDALCVLLCQPRRLLRGVEQAAEEICVQGALYDRRVACVVQVQLGARARLAPLRQRALRSRGGLRVGRLSPAFARIVPPQSGIAGEVTVGAHEDESPFDRQRGEVRVRRVVSAGAP